MKTLIITSTILLAALFLVPGSAPIVAKDRPLDLPAGGIGSEDRGEDSESVIRFFGAEFEGEAFFWCFAAWDF